MLINLLPVTARGRESNFKPTVLALSDRQKSILIGTMLGDGNIKKYRWSRGGGTKQAYGHACLSWTHGDKQVEWLVWKAAQFGQLFKSLMPYRFIDKTRSGRFIYSLQSRCHFVFDEYLDLLYSRPTNECVDGIGKKQITGAVLAKLDDLGLAVWFADDGLCMPNRSGWHGPNCKRHATRSALAISLGAITDDEREMIRDWFIARGLHCSLHREYAHQRFLYFGVDAAADLAQVIRPLTHPTMLYKFKGVQSAS